MSTSIAAETPASSPDRILDIGYAFRKSKVLFSAVELGLFTELDGDTVACEALAERLGVHPRGARDFFDALVALQLLDRDTQGRYANRPDCAPFLDRRSSSYLGGKLDHLNARLYPRWERLAQALRTGEPQSELGTGGYAALYADQSALEGFLEGMSGGSAALAQTLARIIPWHDYRTVIDVGAAKGCVPVEIARAHPHLGGGGFDLPQVEPAFTRFVRENRMEERLRFYPGDFLKEELPLADVLIMGRILHNWDLPTKLSLLQKAHRALPAGGALIVYDTLIDDARRHEAQALLASLNMLIETAGGFEYTATQCMGWMRHCGFDEMRLEPLGSQESAVIGLKPGRETIARGSSHPPSAADHRRCRQDTIQNRHRLKFSSAAVGITRAGNAGRVRHVHCGRNRKMGEGHPSGKYKGRLRSATVQARPRPLWVQTRKNSGSERYELDRPSWPTRQQAGHDVTGRARSIRAGAHERSLRPGVDSPFCHGAATPRHP